MNYPTPELLREVANDQSGDIPDNVRQEMRDYFLAAAEDLEQRGFHATPTRFLITEAKALEMELRGITDAANKDDQVPGWRTFFEGKVHVNHDGTDLVKGRTCGDDIEREHDSLGPFTWGIVREVQWLKPTHKIGRWDQ